MNCLDLESAIRDLQALCTASANTIDTYAPTATLRTKFENKLQQAIAAAQALITAMSPPAS